MIEEVREKRIKIFEITFAIIIVLLLLWLLFYGLFFKKEEDLNNNDNNVVENMDDEVNEKNIYDIYTSSDHMYTLTIVKTNDPKASDDVKEKYQETHNNQNYRNNDAIYYGYLNDIIFEITDINEDVKYSLVKGRLLENDKVFYNFVINKETKTIEEEPSRKVQEKRYFNEDNKGLYHTIKVDGSYFFREEYDEDKSILYINDWTKLGFIKNDYLPANNEIIAYEDLELEKEVVYNFSGQKVTKDEE